MSVDDKVEFFILIGIGAVLILGLSVAGSAAVFVWGRWCAQLLGWA